MKFKYLLFMIAYLGTAAAESSSWQHIPGDGQFEAMMSLPTVPVDSIYEVVPTKVDTALAWHLSNRSFAELTCEDASFLASGHFNCEKGKTPILLRAVYSNGGTGKFSATYKETILFVHHGSLGSPGKVTNTPLIINLPFKPTEIFAWVSGVK